MKTPLLDYYKTILTKVSFKKSLFVKEYDKAVKYLNAVEIEDLNQWIQKTENLKKLIDKPYVPKENMKFTGVSM